ncbi:MAG: flavodoxin family protein, partial [Thermoplasmata archaeon]|nr:flavodoxin family protein [Thermoplasmata archaeon]
MNKLYYFTGTGNSLWVAKQLAKQLSNFSIEPIANLLSDNKKIENPDSDMIGLVFPVYIFGPPLIVNRFINKLKITE